jgi:hypothetical protein
MKKKVTDADVADAIKANPKGSHEQLARRRETCHRCDRPTECKDYVQAFTGRVFCSSKCWDAHLRSEGLL